MAEIQGRTPGGAAELEMAAELRQTQNAYTGPSRRRKAEQYVTARLRPGDRRKGPFHLQARPKRETLTSHSTQSKETLAPLGDRD